jgi:hypothetical protein
VKGRVVVGDGKVGIHRSHFDLLSNQRGGAKIALEPRPLAQCLECFERDPASTRDREVKFEA